MLDDIALFIHIADHRGLAAAAARLSLPPATVTRRLQKLESRLGCRLINRSARGFHLTREGEIYYRECAELVGLLSERAQNLESALHQTSGPLRVLAPPSFAQRTLRAALNGFLSRYPEIQLDLTLSHETEDLPASGADLALRIGPQADSGLTQKRIGRIATVLIAAPGYVAATGMPATPDELVGHRRLVTAPIAQWDLVNSAGQVWRQPAGRPVVMANDLQVTANLVRDGQGISLMPVTEVFDELADGRLIRLLPDWHGPIRDVHLVWSHGRLLPARARLLADWLTDAVHGMPQLQGALPPPPSRP